MRYFYTLLISLTLALLFSCSAKEEPLTLQNSPLVELMAPTLAAAIVSAEAAIQTALLKPDYAEATVTSLVTLNEQLDLLKAATALVTERRANIANAEQLANSAEQIHQLRGLIEADIIVLKDTNAAAAIRLGVVNELAEFCQLTASDISQALRPIASN